MTTVEWTVDNSNIHHGYGNVPAIDIDEYPAVKKHLLSYGKELQQSGMRLFDGTRSRTEGLNMLGLNLQDTCAYHEEFKSEKLLWIDA